MQLKESLWHMQRSEGPHLRLPVKLEHGVLLCWALNTETRVVTPKRRAGKESEGRVCLQSENILFLLPTHQDKSGLAQLTGCHTAEPSPARSAGGGPVRCGEALQLLFAAETQNCRNSDLSNLSQDRRGFLGSVTFRASWEGSEPPLLKLSWCESPSLAETSSFNCWYSREIVISSAKRNLPTYLKVKGI